MKPYFLLLLPLMASAQTNVLPPDYFCIEANSDGCEAVSDVFGEPSIWYVQSDTSSSSFASADPPAAAPEVGAHGAAAAITFLFGILAITRGRRLWQSQQSSI